MRGRLACLLAAEEQEQEELGFLGSSGVAWQDIYLVVINHGCSRVVPFPMWSIQWRSLLTLRPILNEQKKRAVELEITGVQHSTVKS